MTQARIISLTTVLVAAVKLIAGNLTLNVFQLMQFEFITAIFAIAKSSCFEFLHYISLASDLMQLQTAKQFYCSPQLDYARYFVIPFSLHYFNGRLFL